MPTEACLEEFEALTAIFLDEIVIGEELSNGDTTVSMILYPATGDDQESKYVTLTLELTLPSDYPSISPQIRFRNPRGLSETLLDSLYRTMKETCSERLESQMIFELIDMGKEFLTINNRPASECPICLLSFTSCDIFFRSQCFHHFHSYCLGRYLQNVMQVAASGEHLPGDEPGKTCPVCRETLDDDIDIKKLLESPPPVEESLEVVDGDAILKEWHSKQDKLKRLFEKQKSQGGIIDLSENDKKRLVISSPRAPPPPPPDGSDSPSSSSASSCDGGGGVTTTTTTTTSASGQGQGQVQVDPEFLTVKGALGPPSTETHSDKLSYNRHHKNDGHGRHNYKSRGGGGWDKDKDKQNSHQVKSLVTTATTTGTGAKSGQDSSAPSNKIDEKEDSSSEGGTAVDERERNGKHHGYNHHHHHHHGRGKGGHYGHGRRRYK